MDICIFSALLPPASCPGLPAAHCFTSSFHRQAVYPSAPSGTYPPQSAPGFSGPLWKWELSLVRISPRSCQALPRRSCLGEAQLLFPVASFSGDTSSQHFTQETRRRPSDSKIGSASIPVVAARFSMVLLSCLLVKAIATHSRWSEKCCFPPPQTVLTCSLIRGSAFWNGLRRNAAPSLDYAAAKAIVCWKNLLQPFDAAAGELKEASADRPEVSRQIASALFVHGRTEAAGTPAYCMLFVGDPPVGTMVRNKGSLFVAQELKVQGVAPKENLSSDLHQKLKQPGETSASSQELQSSEEDIQYQDWLEAVKDEAIGRGVSDEVVRKAFEGVKPSQQIIRLKQNQPEYKLSAREYMACMVSDYRVSKGVTSYMQNEQLLADVSSKYGVPPSVLVAIWGIESSYGGFPGSWDVIEALVTMAFKGETDPKRASYFREELIQALIIMNEGHGPPGGKRLLGSWAGAMGQCQFMPSSFQNFAVDYDGDGRKDIWESRADIFASMANFLKQHGWQQGAPIAQKVSVPKRMDKGLIGLHTKKSAREWHSRYKIFKTKGEPDLSPDDMVSLIAPDGPKGDTYLVCDNFRTIMRYNPSSLYSIAILELSQLIGHSLESTQKQ